MCSMQPCSYRRKRRCRYISSKQIIIHSVPYIPAQPSPHSFPLRIPSARWVRSSVHQSWGHMSRFLLGLVRADRDSHSSSPGIVAEVLATVVTASSGRSRHAGGRGGGEAAIVQAGARTRIDAWCLQGSGYWTKRALERKQI